MPSTANPVAEAAPAHAIVRLATQAMGTRFELVLAEAQVGGGDLGAAQVGRPAFERDAALLEAVQPVASREGTADVT